MGFKTTVTVIGKNKKERDEILANKKRVATKAFHAETIRIAGVRPEILKIHGEPAVIKKDIIFTLWYDHPKELNLYGEPLPSKVKPLLLSELKKYATSLEITGAHTKKRATLVTAICKLKGYDQENEPAEVIEYLIAGGRIKECPAQKAPMLKPTKTTQALQKPAKPKKKTRVRKRGPRGEPVAREIDPNSVSLGMILKELGVSSRIARRKLRGSDISKPGTAWVWPKSHKDIKKVKELLK